MAARSPRPEPASHPPGQPLASAWVPGAPSFTCGILGNWEPCLVLLHSARVAHRVCVPMSPGSQCPSSAQTPGPPAGGASVWHSSHTCPAPGTSRGQRPVCCRGALRQSATLRTRAQDPWGAPLQLPASWRTPCPEAGLPFLSLTDGETEARRRARLSQHPGCYVFLGHVLLGKDGLGWLSEGLGSP